MDIYLPVAGMSVNLLLVVGLGGVVGFLLGIFGIGGGFLLTPLLMMIGVPPTVAVATGANQIVGASASGAFASLSEGKIDIRLGSYLLIGSTVGGFAGVELIHLLKRIGNVDLLINVSYVLMLGLTGAFMLLASYREAKEGPGTASESNGGGPIARLADRLPLQREFPLSGIRASLVALFILGFVVGVLSALMGVGGGFLIVPAMIYMLRMPISVVVGTSFFQILFTTVIVTFLQAMTNRSVDIFLALILLAGSTVGAQLGIRVGRRIEPRHFKVILASIVLVVGVGMMVQLVVPPRFLLNDGAH